MQKELMCGRVYNHSKNNIINNVYIQVYMTIQREEYIYATCLGAGASTL